MDPVDGYMARALKTLNKCAVAFQRMFMIPRALNFHRRGGKTELGAAAGADNGSFSLKPSPPGFEIPVPIKPVSRSQNLIRVL
jgi:hypothetical protein